VKEQRQLEGFHQQTTFVRVFYRMYTSVFNNENLKILSLETILTMLYTIYHILVHNAGPLPHISFQLELTPLSGGGYGTLRHSTSFTSCWFVGKLGPPKTCGGRSHRRYCSTSTHQYSDSSSYRRCKGCLRYTRKSSRAQSPRTYCCSGNRDLRSR